MAWQERWLTGNVCSSPQAVLNGPLEVIRLAVMMYMKYPLSLRNDEDLLHERGIDISYETVRRWWNRFGPMFAGERVDRMTEPASPLPLLQDLARGDPPGGDAFTSATHSRCGTSRNSRANATGDQSTV
jgi:hypothetical protein